MKVCYAVVRLTHGAGQTSTLREMVRAGEGTWTSEILCSQADHEAIREFPSSVNVNVVPYVTSIVDDHTIGLMSDADIVHIKSGVPYFCTALKIGRPSVYTLHQPDPTWLFGGRARVSRYIADVAERPWLLSRATLVASVSPWIAEWYRKERGLNSEVIPDIIDLSEFVPGSDSASRVPVEPRLLVVGDWDGPHGRKRTDELVQIMPAVLTEFPQTHLTVAGLSEWAMNQLSGLTEAAGAQDAIDLRGKVSRAELVKLYQSATIYVCPSLVEGFYRPLIEAFACGLPAVVREPPMSIPIPSRAPLLHLRASGAGRTYDGSAHSLCMSIRFVLNHLAELSEAGRAYARCFTREAVAPLLRSMYLKCLH